MKQFSFIIAITAIIFATSGCSDGEQKNHEAQVKVGPDLPTDKNSPVGQLPSDHVQQKQQTEAQPKGSSQQVEKNVYSVEKQNNSPHLTTSPKPESCAIYDMDIDNNFYGGMKEYGAESDLEFF